MTIFTKTHIAKAISIKNNDSTFNFLALFLIFLTSVTVFMMRLTEYRGSL